MFWDRTEVEWSPGSGNRKVFRLLGRVGENSQRLEVADFRDQRGIYVLYDDHGPVYVGLTVNQGLGARLRAHDRSYSAQEWDRFSWFGFRSVLAEADSDGVRKLGALPEKLLSNSQHAIGDVEALLIQTLGTYRVKNKQQMRFASAQCWKQVKWDEWDKYLSRLSP